MIEKVVEWYGGLKAWQKIFVFVPFVILLLVLFAAAGLALSSQRVARVGGLQREMESHSTEVNDAVKKKDEFLEKEIHELEELRDKVEEERKQDAQIREGIHDQIDDADSFDDVDAALRNMRR